MTAKCYVCKHRRDVPGDAHSLCAASDMTILIMASILGARPRLNPHGVRSGWANWPINFDPMWVGDCQYFVSKE